jgi:hypothetical protein
VHLRRRETVDVAMDGVVMLLQVAGFMRRKGSAGGDAGEFALGGPVRLFITIERSDREDLALPFAVADKEEKLAQGIFRARRLAADAPVKTYRPVQQTFCIPPRVAPSISRTFIPHAWPLLWLIAPQCVAINATTEHPAIVSRPGSGYGRHTTGRRADRGDARRFEALPRVAVSTLRKSGVLSASRV